MPRFYFHIHNDDVTLDEEGQDLSDIEAARAMAIRSAREMICDEVRDGRVTLSYRIEVVDADEQPVLTVTYGEAVRVDP